MTRLLGWTPEELVGRDALELVHPDDRAAALDALRVDRRSLGTGSLLEFRVVHRDGRWRTFEGVGRNLPVLRSLYGFQIFEEIAVHPSPLRVPLDLLL